MAETRTIKIESLTRVEGEGALCVRLQDGEVETVELNIFEPPRLFEAFLRGRPLEEIPDLTARICGICPIAYQMSSVHAIEAALGMDVSPEIRRLRRLIYCGEWIESHALHMHLLQIPDFFGYASGIEMAKDFPKEIKRGLQLKKHGNRMLELMGGRCIHPVNTAVGGFYRTPARRQMLELIADFEWGREAAIETARWVAGFDYPDFQRPYELVAVSHPDEYAMNEGEIASSEGWSIPVEQFEETFTEYQVPHSTALQAERTDRGTCYLTGPLARINLNRERLSPTARRLADELKLPSPCHNPFQSIIARALEVIHSYEEALQIMRDYRPVRPPRAEYQHRLGEGCAATEAPRGLLYHRYKIDEGGKITEARIVPPTSQNQRQIEDDLRYFLPSVLSPDHDQVANACERLIRSYDPCISCSTHFLKLHLEGD